MKTFNELTAGEHLYFTVVDWNASEKEHKLVYSTKDELINNITSSGYSTIGYLKSGAGVPLDIILETVDDSTGKSNYRKFERNEYNCTQKAVYHMVPSDSYAGEWILIGMFYTDGSLEKEMLKNIVNSRKAHIVDEIDEYKDKIKSLHREIRKYEDLYNSIK